MKVDTVADASAQGDDTSTKQKRGHDGQGPRQPGRKKANPPASTNNQQQQQRQAARPQDQPSRAAAGKMLLRNEVLKLLSAEDIVPDGTPLLTAVAAAAAAASEPSPVRPKQPDISRPSSAPASTGGMHAAQHTAFGSSAQRAAPAQDTLASPTRPPAAADAAALNALRLRSTSSGLDGPAVAAAGLLALATAAGSCSPCSSPQSAGTRQAPLDKQHAAPIAEPPTQAQAGAAAADEADDAAQTLITCAFPPMTAVGALAAAFPAAPEDSAAAADTGAGAGARAAAAPAQKRAPARPVVPSLRPEDITADTLCVADVGTFMGHRMFKTPFACWASWLKEAGPGSDAVLSTQVSELLPTLSPFLQHLRLQVASKMRGEPGLAAWTARGYMCYVKLVLEKLQQQQPDEDYKQLLRKATVATNEFEQQARHGRTFEASPPASPKASASSRSSKAAAAGVGGKAKGKGRPPRKPAAAGVMSKLRPRKSEEQGTKGAAEREESPAAQQQDSAAAVKGSGAGSEPAAPDAAAAAGAGTGKPAGGRKLRLRLRAPAAAAAEGENGGTPAAGALDSPNGMVLGLLAPLPAPGAAEPSIAGDMQAGGAEAPAAAPADAPMQEGEPASASQAAATGSHAHLLQTLQAYAAEVEAVADLADLEDFAGADAADPADTPAQDAPGSVELLAAVQIAVAAQQGAPQDGAAGQLGSGQQDGVVTGVMFEGQQQQQDQQQEAATAAPGADSTLQEKQQQDGKHAAVDQEGVLAAVPAAAADSAGVTAPAGSTQAAAAPKDEAMQDAAAESSAGGVSPSAAEPLMPAAAPAVSEPDPAALLAVESFADDTFVSMAELQQQVQGCEVGMQLLWDVAQASYGDDVDGTQLDAADLLLRCSDAETLQACQQQCLEAPSEDDAGQAQYEQTLEVVGGLLELLHQPVMKQLLGAEQHRERMENVTAVYEAMLQAGQHVGGSDGESPESSSPGGFQAPAVPMACTTLG